MVFKYIWKMHNTKVHMFIWRICILIEINIIVWKKMGACLQAQQYNSDHLAYPTHFVSYKNW